MLLFHTNFETISHGEKKIGRTYKAVFSVDRHDEYLEYYEMTFAVNKTKKNCLILQVRISDQLLR